MTHSPHRTTCCTPAATAPRDTRVARLFAAALILLSLLWWARPGTALDDPSLKYRTLETPHFYVHYDSELEDLAWRVASISEEAWLVMTPLLDWVPAEKTHVVIDDKFDTANGSANVFGRNRMTVYAMPPEPEGVLGNYDDWLRILVFHEFAHILQLDTTSGLAPIINWFIGKQINPNQVLPRWYIEGMATLYESRLTGSGRVHGARYQMWLRTAALDDALFTLGQATGTPVAWPSGNAAYLYGGFFLDYITRTYGPDFIPRFNHEYGSRIIPFSLNQSARTIGEKTFDEMWHEFTAETQAKAQAQRVAVRAAGETRLQVLTHGGGGNRYPAARPGHDQISYFRANLVSASAFALLGEDESGARFDTTLLRLKGATGAHAWSPDGQTLFFARNVIRDNVYIHHELFSYDVRSARTRQLTHRERAREPAVSPDGRRLAYVRNLHGTMELVVRDLSPNTLAEPEVIVGARQWPVDDERHWQQFSSPTWHPTRNALAFSAWRLDTGRRNLWLYDFERPAGARLIQLTDDAASDLEPHFGADELLYFSSDRTGIFNAYMMDIDTGHVWQLSNVLSGAFNPVPSADRKWLYVTTYTVDGYEIARLRRRDNPARPAPPPPAVAARVEYPPVDATDWEQTNYQPWRWLWPLTLDPEIAMLMDGTGLGATLAGHDPVGHHSWQVTGLWTRGADVLEQSSAVVASYAYGGWPLEVGLNAGFRTYPNTRDFVAESQYIPFSERSAFATLSMGYPISHIADSLNFSTSLRLNHTAFFSGPEVTHDPEDIPPRFPEDGWFSDLNFGLSYANLNFYPQGVSATDGFNARIGLGLQHDLRDTTNKSVGFSYHLAGYLSVPWLEHHVVTARVTGGILRSTFPGSRGFGIGGYSTQHVLADLVMQRPSNPFVLRGYPPGFTRGDQYQVWTAEYRLPIWTLDKGFSTVPLYLRRIKGLVFFDAGGAFSGYLADHDFLKSVGAEAQLDTTVGYFLGSSLRAGYALGLDDGGIHSFYLRYGAAF